MECELLSTISPDEAKSLIGALGFTTSFAMLSLGFYLFSVAWKKWGE